MLVTDFYAAYHAIECRKQKCLVHLLRDLHALREELARHHVKKYIQPLITLLQDAIQLAKARNTLCGRTYKAACEKIETRLETIIRKKPKQPDDGGQIHQLRTADQPGC